MNRLCQKRQRTTDQLCDNDRAEHRQRHDQRNIRSIARQEENPQEVDRRERHTQNQRHAQLLPYHLGRVGEMQLIHRKAADDERRALGTAVAARIHQHGDEGHQQRHRGECGLVFRDDGPRDAR